MNLKGLKMLGSTMNRMCAVISVASALVASACGDDGSGPAASAATTPIALPTPVPKLDLLYPKPDPSTLVAGYTVDSDGCVVTTPRTPAATPRPVDESELVKLYGNKTSSFYAARGGIYLENGEFANAIPDLQKALTLAGGDPKKVDYSIRLPLSIALFRDGKIDEAKYQLRTMLSHEDPARRTYDTSAHGIALLRAGAYRAGFDELYRTPPGFNEISFGDSGAAAHLGNGLRAAGEGRFEVAMREWQLADTCSDYFQVPHLMRGFVYHMRGENAMAADEWIRTLQGWDPATPDSAGITDAQYDAMRQLL